MQRKVQTVTQQEPFSVLTVQPTNRSMLTQNKPAAWGGCLQADAQLYAFIGVKVHQVLFPDKLLPPV